MSNLKLNQHSSQKWLHCKMKGLKKAWFQRSFSGKNAFNGPSTPTISQRKQVRGCKWPVSIANCWNTRRYPRSNYLVKDALYPIASIAGGIGTDHLKTWWDRNRTTRGMLPQNSTCSDLIPVGSPQQNGHQKVTEAAKHPFKRVNVQ